MCFPGGWVIKNLPVLQNPQEICVQSLGQEYPLEEGMATHSRILAWRNTWADERGRVSSQRVGHHWKDFISGQFICLVLSNSLQHHGLQHARLPCKSQLPELGPTHVHRVSDDIQRSHLLSSPSPPVFSLAKHQGLFQWVSSLYQVAKVLHIQLQQLSFQWIFRTYFLYDWLVWSPYSSRDSQDSSPTPQFKSINSLVLSFLYSPTPTSIHDYWKNHSFEYMGLCPQNNVTAF